MKERKLGRSRRRTTLRGRPLCKEAGKLWFCEVEFGDGCGAVGWRGWVCSG